MRGNKRPVLALFAQCENAYKCSRIALCVASLPGLQLKLILSADGITPGSVLAPDNRRKSIVWYCSFLEFGNKPSYEQARTSLHDVGLQLRGNNRKQSPLSSFLLRQRGNDRTSNTPPMTRTLALRTKWAKKVKGGVSRLSRDIFPWRRRGGN